MDCMLDLETLSTAQNAVILSIGAVKFNAFTLQEPYEELNLKLEIDDQIARGRDVSESTLEWWSKQPAEVQEASLGEANRVSVEDFCAQLNRFVVGADKIWCQGPHFDITMLDSIFKQYGMNLNWAYWQVMDSRTLFGVLGDPREKGRATLHDAVEDSREQAKGVQILFNQLGISKYANRF